MLTPVSPEQFRNALFPIPVTVYVVPLYVTVDGMSTVPE